ncbi:N-acetylglucosamine-6-phosphate deacetylase [Miniphocaeibacter massiliensis]|uniref:N-acetylglucosamine-6-phosphate deacetylase n=1 Tax=Miniphocaeibacter massiliensis TaxID=2041841 RepID=UPI000C1C41DB|nr:N-acetylglucosamine-6-phosphate deacetylase [Miniphocaeibacter massiliensis]
MSEALYLKVKEIFLKDRTEENKIIEIVDGKIKAFLDEVPVGKRFMDYSDYIAAPGYVDTHIHGYGGHDIMDGEKESVLEISKGIVKTGITTFLATTLTASQEDLDKACKVVGEVYKDVKGAKIAGIFLEGPFFTEKYKGAQNPEYMSAPNYEKLKKWYDLSNGIVRKIAIAPELEGTEEFVKKAKELGVYVALGHSDATYEEAYDAVMAGASIFVHVYNGMSPLHHRKPGMVGAALSLKDVFAELICDGHHVHPAAANIVMKARGKDEVVLITDCMMAGGMPEGEYKLGDFDVHVKDGTARLDSGSLAGSVLRLEDAVKNVIKWGIATPFEAVQMASQIPAKSVGIDDEAGIIDIGRYADINIMDDSASIIATYINGELKASR